MNKCSIKSVLDQEIVHYFDGNNLISSKHLKVEVRKNDHSYKFKLPFELIDLFGFSRILRRLLRLDKCNIFPIDEEFKKLLIIRQKKVFVFDTKLKKFNFKFSLKQCRNVMHNSICKTECGKIFFGEYGANDMRDPVPIYKSEDLCESWEQINLFKKDEIKHIHNISYDKFTKSIWITTGDSDGECKIIRCDLSFETKDIYGDGTQTWRSCSLIFRENNIYWLMDSPNETSFFIEMNRKTGVIKKLQQLDGPVWYTKELSEGSILAGVSVEPGNAVKTSSAQLLYTNDLKKWHCLKSFAKDSLTMKFFKFGVISFSDGRQSMRDFYISGEALKDIDGKSINLSISIT